MGLDIMSNETRNSGVMRLEMVGSDETRKIRNERVMRLAMAQSKETRNGLDIEE